MGHRDPWCRRRCPGDLEEPPGDHRLDHRTSAPVCSREVGVGLDARASCRAPARLCPVSRAAGPGPPAAPRGPSSRPSPAPPAAALRSPRGGLSAPGSHSGNSLSWGRGNWVCRTGLSPQHLRSSPCKDVFLPDLWLGLPGLDLCHRLPAGPPAGGKTVSLTVHGGDVCPCPDLL